jgi:zinc transporter ZupT
MCDRGGTGSGHAGQGMIPATLLAVLGLVLIHTQGYRLRFLDVIPRSRLLSMAGGMSVAYIFLRILPDLGRSQAMVGYEVQEALKIPRHSIYLVALLGLVVFYGLQRLTVRSRRQRDPKHGEADPSPTVFWVSMASYSIINFAVGYLLFQREVQGLGTLNLTLFFVAMSLWFVVNDYGLRHEHRERYRSVGRWVLSGVVVLGWLAGVVAPVPQAVLSLVLAFVAGGVILNVLKEELPEERESRFWAFALGAAGYAALLLAI